MKLEIISRSQDPVRRIAKQARQMPDPVERLRFLRRWLLMVPRNDRWGVPPWPPEKVVLAAVIVIVAATAALIWLEF